MKLEHFYSAWNDTRSDKPYHKTPSEAVISQAKENGKAYEGNCVVFASDNLVEVRMRLIDGIAMNSYKDFYRIAK